MSEGWEQAKAGWTHTYAAYHNFVGHRFKQVLIDDEISGKASWMNDIRAVLSD